MTYPKVMTTITMTAFEGADPNTGETRTMTIGRFDPAELADDVGRWAHDVAERMLRGDARDDLEPDDPDAEPAAAPAPAPRPVVPAPFEEVTLWSDQ